MSRPPHRRAATGRPGRRPRRDPFVTGIALIVGLAVITYAIFTKHVPFVHGYRMSAIFQSSNQLIKGSPVRIAGVDVGKVRAVGRGPGTTARVEMDIRDSALPIHRDATLRIRPRLFLEGSFYVDLSPGSPSAPKVPSGGTIPLPQTAIPVQFHQVLTALDRPTRDSLRSAVRELAVGLDGGGAQGLRAAARPLAPSFRDLAWIAQAARGTSPDDVVKLVRSTSRITGTLASRDAQLAELVTNLNATTGALADQDVALAASVRELDAVLQRAPGALSAIDRTLPVLERFAAALDPSLRIAPPILVRASAVLVQLRAAARPAELPRLLTYLRPTLRTLPGLESKLVTLSPLITPVADCLRDRAVPVLTATVPDGALSTGRPVWQDLVHALVGLSSANQDFDGNGPWLRYLAGAGPNGITTTLPGFGTIVGGNSQPIEGARPQWLGSGVSPTFRPDQPCRHQAPVDLSARTGAVGAQSRATSAPRTDGAAARREVERLLGRAPARGAKPGAPGSRGR